MGAQGGGTRGAPPTPAGAVAGGSWGSSGVTRGVVTLCHPLVGRHNLDVPKRHPRGTTVRPPPRPG